MTLKPENGPQLEDLNIQERLKRFCVFCGKLPQSQNKEHIVPRWLIEMTGDLKRQITLGRRVYDDPSKILKFAFDSFQFPACEACNTKFSHLEGKAKKIMTDILADKEITAGDAVVFLDWFDKVRAGLWLGQIYLHKLNHITPHFYIENRIRRSDRMLLIYKLELAPKAWGSFGPETPLFHHHPTCFGMLVNGYVFLNCATDFLLSPRLGFPFLKNVKLAAVEGHHQSILTGSFFEGFGRIKGPVIDYALPEPRMAIYQPILTVDRYDITNEELSSDDFKYFRQNCYEGETGLGKIFAKGDKISSLELDEKIPFNKKERIFNFENINSLMIEAYKLHLHECNKLLQDLSELDVEKRRTLRLQYKGFSQFTNLTIEGLKNKIPQRVND